MKQFLCLTTAMGFVYATGCVPAYAAEPAPNDAQTSNNHGIPAMELSPALSAFSHNTGVQIVYVSKLVEGVKTRGAPAGLSPKETLQKLLEGTGLKFRFLNDGTVTVFRDVTSGNIEPGRNIQIARAEETEPSSRSGAAQQATTSQAGLEQITVTAQRRAENLQSVPIAVTAITADSLQASGITNMKTVYVSVPGLQISQYIKNAQFFIRGVGSSASVAGDEANVAIYVDSVYYPGNSNVFFSFNNIERVEVLKGPQGTLFGRNSEGGAVSVTTRDPKAEPSFRTSIDYGNYNTFEASAYATGGTDKVASDLAFYTIKQGTGFGRNLATGEEINKRNEYAFRSKTVFTPSDKDRFVFSADYDSDKTTLGLANNLLPGVIGAGGYPFRGTPFDTQSGVPTRIPYADSWGLGIRYERTLDWATLTALSAYHRFRQNFEYDADNTPASYEYAPVQKDDEDVYQNEVLMTGTSGRFQWTAGAVALHLTGGYDPIVVSSAASPNVNVIISGKIATDSYAGYGQTTYALTPTTKVTGGIRYTYDKRNMNAAFLLLVDAPPPMTLVSKTGT